MVPPALLDVAPSELQMTDSQPARPAVWRNVRKVAASGDSALRRTAEAASSGIVRATDYAVQNQENIRGLGGGLSTLLSDATLPAMGGMVAGYPGIFVGHTVQQVAKLAMRDAGAGGVGQAAASGVAAASGRAALGAASVVRQNWQGSSHRLDMPPHAAAAASSSEWPPHLPRPPPARRRSASPTVRHRSASPPLGPPPWPQWLPQPPPHPRGPQPPPPYPAGEAKAAGRRLSAFQARDESLEIGRSTHGYLARDPRVGPMVAPPNSMRR